MNYLALAIAITSEAFKDKVDKGGKPYMLHCIRVMNGVDQNDEELMTIAILHDLLEDRPDLYKVNDLWDLGFSSRVVEAVALLTHKKDVHYDDYIKGIATNNDARRVKLSDLIDNSNFYRLKGLTKKDFDRMEKYQRAFVYLSRV